ncbi:MAG: hypothetical protein HDP34_00690 [Clostridia bacterium]|nr:hypothetical protein [Clostridia bacterium]
MSNKSQKIQKKKSVSNNIRPINIIPPENMTSDELQHIIANAILDAEYIKEQRIIEQKEKEKSDWREKIGAKKNKNKIKDIFNGLKVLFKVSFMPKKNIKGDSITIGLLKFFLSLFFDIVSVLLLLTGLYLIFIIHFQHLIINTPKLAISTNIISIAYGFLILVLSRLFRIASIETEQIEDRNHVFGIFTSVTSLISIIIAVVALVKGG